jgi:endonuclease/exonuclease/phosphatase family metal-dependent hydrolase
MHLKVMTLNLLCAGAVNPAGPWSQRFPLVLDVLRAGADIIALQEATATQLADIERELTDFSIIPGPESGEMRLPKMVHTMARLWHGAKNIRNKRHHTHLLPAHPPKHRGEHCALLYRTEKYAAIAGNAFWISHQPDVVGSILPGTVLPRVVNWVRLQEKDTLQSVTVFNAHLDFMPWAPLRSARILRRILDTHWDNLPQILMGDFNAVPNSAAYKHLGRELEHNLHPRLEDAWLAAEEKQGPEGTYHGGTGRVRWIGRLDRILFRPNLRVERAVTLTHHKGTFYPSDHYPVLAELRAK